jgi:hypothetical protein
MRRRWAGLLFRRWWGGLMRRRWAGLFRRWWAGLMRWWAGLMRWWAGLFRSIIAVPLFRRRRRSCFRFRRWAGLFRRWSWFRFRRWAGLFRRRRRRLLRRGSFRRGWSHVRRRNGMCRFRGTGASCWFFFGTSQRMNILLISQDIIKADQKLHFTGSINRSTRTSRDPTSYLGGVLPNNLSKTVTHTGSPRTGVGLTVPVLFTFTPLVGHLPFTAGELVVGHGGESDILTTFVFRRGFTFTVFRPRGSRVREVVVPFQRFATPGGSLGVVG